MANSLLFGQCTGYVLAMFFAFFVVVPLAQNGNDFKGRCLLYTQGSWQRANDTALPIQKLPPSRLSARPAPTVPASSEMEELSKADKGTQQPQQDQQKDVDYDIEYWVDGTAGETGRGAGGRGGKQRLTSSEGGDATGPSYVVSAWGAPSACQFATFSGIVSLLLAAVQAWRSVFFQCKGHDDTLFAAFINLVGSGLMAMMMFVASTVVSVGFNVWCSGFTNQSGSPYSCEDAQEMNLNMDVITTSFYTHFGVIQFGLWSGWLTWVALAGLAFAKVYRSHRQSDLLHSLAREKELLLSRAVMRGSAGITSPERQPAAVPRDGQPSVYI